MNLANTSAINAERFPIATSFADATKTSCDNMTVTVNSCQTFVFNVMNSTNITEYELRQRILFDTTDFGAQASDSGGAFVASMNSNFPAGYTWLLATPAPSSLFSGWKQLKYPQESWVLQSPSCIGGVSCDTIPVAPSMRYQHSTVSYLSWNFRRDVLEHESLCKAQGYNNTNCTSTCLTDTACAVNASAIPAGPTWSISDFYRINVQSTFWTALDSVDDGFQFPMYGPNHVNCPNKCCSDRRLCMRSRDNLGRVVPFDRPYMLVFGGRTRQKLLVNGTTDLYLHCEAILANMTASNTTNQAFASCYEDQSDELWRYDTVDDIWELIKPNSAVSSGSAQTVPYGRYGHASTLVVIPAAKDLINTRRQYMFMFGGMSLRCEGGFCSDLWRYEIPWAAQAYWSPALATSLSTYNRGNVWTRMTDCPYGGRFRHSMVATEAADLLYIFGGETADSWEGVMMIYRIAPDSWDVLAPLGYRYFTRSAYDYLGNLRLQNLTDFSTFDHTTDTVASAIPQPNATTALTTKYFPQFPVARGDHAMLQYSDLVEVTRSVVNTTDNTTSTVVSNETQPVIWIIGGYRTYNPPYPLTTVPNFQYYLKNNIWELGSNVTTWKQMFTSADFRLPVPPARRGATAAILPRTTPEGLPDDILVYYGGNRADTLFSGLWGLEFKRTNRAERMWREIGGDFDPGQTPAPVSYHTMNLIGSKLFVFGGLNWTQSDLAESDVLTDSDRRCFMSARNIVKITCEASATDPVACALALAKSEITSVCAASNSTTSSSSFCCGVDLTSVATLADLSTLCTSQCQTDSFEASMSLGFGEGMWIYDPNICVNDCSGNGKCMFSACVCEPGWSGNDCSVKNCPGSFCYYDPFTKEQHCNSCSGNGVCNGTCTCDAGWAGLDCSSVVCGDSCATNGQCLEDFPTQQCICDAGFSGMDCQTRLCLNGCSLGGECQESTGTCACRDNFLGDDCSVYVPTLAGNVGITGSTYWYIVPLLITMLGLNFAS